jgi:hypothetical protein
MKYIRSLAILCLFILLVSIVKLYIDGTILKCNNSLDNSIIYKLKLKLPDKIIINKLLDSSLQFGDKLNRVQNISSGTKLNYYQLSELVPEIVQYYENYNFNSILEPIIGKKLYMLENDKYKLFSKLYVKDNDFIDWHYDNNFSSGLRYTLIIPLILDKCNTSNLMVTNQKTCNKSNISLSLGDAVLFDGSNVYHSITKQTNDCKRLSIIIPLYEIPYINLYGRFMVFIRNIGFDLFKL